jgi:peptidyl-prolyl cis-trans isomerase D
MSVIQNIRDKYARWAVIAIALSLIGFIMMDAFAGKGGLFNNRGSNTLGKVNGTKIDRIQFDKEMQMFGRNVPEEQRPSLIQNLWDYDVSKIVVAGEAEDLGLTVTDRELRDALYGENPPQFLAEVFTDRNTGKFDAVTAQQQVNQILKKGSPGQNEYDYITSNIELLKNQLIMSKYMTLMTSSIYYPKWFLEKRNIDNSLIGRMSYVAVPYATIADSTIKISDEEIKNYIQKHKDEYKREKETRSVEYVLFSTAPSAADSVAIKNELQDLKPQFQSAPDPGAFVNQQNTAFTFEDKYYPKSAIQVPSKDSLFSLPTGTVYGPYLDNSHYVMARVIDVKTMPDSAKVKHILIQSAGDAQSDSVAKARIDSIKTAIDKGASFDTLAKRFSADKGSAEKGGLLEMPLQTGGTTDYFTQGAMVTEFNDAVFNGKVGEEKIVKTQFGYHLIKILDLKGYQPYYKIAYMAREITTSPETDNEVHNLAAMFAGDSRDYKSFNTNFDKNVKPKGYNKQVATDVDEMQFNMMGISSSARPFVKEVFDADKGDVIGPVSLPDGYVVGVVTAVNEPGLPDVATVRPMVEPVLRNKKKADMIVKNIGQITTLEQVSAKVNQPVQTVDSLRFTGGPAFGYEPKVIGAVFNPANIGKVVNQPLVGNSGVYVIRVEDVSTTPVETANVEQQRQQMEMQAKNQIMQQMQYGANPILEPLKKNADIKDYRAKFY